MNSERIITTALVAGAGFVASRLLNVAWKAATGHKPPTGIEADGEVSVTEVALFAAISGALVAVVQAQANKRAKRWVGKSA